MESEYLLFMSAEHESYTLFHDRLEVSEAILNRIRKRIAKGSIVSVIIRNPRY